MVSIQICRWQNYNYSIGGREYIPTRLKTMVSCRKINLKQMCKMNLPIWYDAGGSHMLWYSVHVIRRPAGCSCTTCLVLAKLRLKCLLRRIFDSAAPLPPKKNAGRNPGDNVLREPAQSKCTWTFQKSNLILRGNVQEKCRTPIPRHTFCASLRSRNAHGHFRIRRAILCGNLPRQCRTPIPRQAFCASLRSRNAHGHFTRAILCWNLQEKCRTLRWPPGLNIGP